MGAEEGREAGEKVVGRRRRAPGVEGGVGDCHGAGKSAGAGAGARGGEATGARAA